MYNKSRMGKPIRQLFKFFVMWKERADCYLLFVWRTSGSMNYGAVSSLGRLGLSFGLQFRRCLYLVPPFYCNKHTIES